MSATTHSSPPSKVEGGSMKLRAGFPGNRKRGGPLARTAPFHRGMEMVSIYYPQNTGSCGSAVKRPRSTRNKCLHRGQHSPSLSVILDVMTISFAHEGHRVVSPGASAFSKPSPIITSGAWHCGHLPQPNSISLVTPILASQTGHGTRSPAVRPLTADP